MRDRLIELLGKELMEYASWQTEMALAGNYDMPSVEEVIAEKILKDGWMRPPCKVGDKVYIVAEVTNKIIECNVIGVWICEGNCSIITDHGTIYSLSLGETVFITREEAEAKLKGGVQE